MPESVTPRLEEVSEEALKERITLRKVSAAVEMYDQLLQADLFLRSAQEEAGEETKRRKPKGRRASDHLRTSWKENNNAERIFNLLPEKDSRCFSALIRGMVKELLNQMNEQKVRPNLLTFNSVLKALRRCGFLAKTYAPQTLNEMKALGIAPSLATYDHILAWSSDTVCSTQDDPVLCCSLNNPPRLHRSGRFFSLLCMMEHIDVVLKWYSRIIPSVSPPLPPRCLFTDSCFRWTVTDFSLWCLQLYYPNPQGMRDLLQALDTDGRLDLLPTIWKDIKTLGHDNKVDLVEELLSLMAREEHSPEVCFLSHLSDVDVSVSLWTCCCSSKPKTEFLRKFAHRQLSYLQREALQGGQVNALCVTLPFHALLCREVLLNNFLSVCQSSGAPKRAVELVQLAAAFCLPATPVLAKTALAEFQLTDEQR
ncbi:hypothetical protein XENOCAPTIV_030628 [Xenoophorus captivus]|uniref:Small ribosomal subunit protein mS39 n=1 Tax=Xenoophorus captivus TaxID=1517983 RepID=A0ABV0RV07_9TELE